MDEFCDAVECIRAWADVAETSGHHCRAADYRMAADRIAALEDAVARLTREREEAYEAAEQSESMANEWEQLHAALVERSRPSPAPSEAVRVKPLVWEVDDAAPAVHDADGCDYLYRILARHDGRATIRYNGSMAHQEDFSSLDEAKKAAQMHFANRIIAALASEAQQ